jgi:glycosyltransferase involved in cell wall biosynthesis
VKHDAPLPVSDPLVSVIVTCFNYAEFIADAVRSVHAQNYQRFECIIVDDCSTDETPAVVMAVLDELQDARFRSLRLPRNLGQLGAQIEGFHESSGEFVVFLDADDLLFPRFIERHLFVHHNLETAVGFTSADQWTIARDGQVLSKHHADLASRVYLAQGLDVQVKDEHGDQRPVQGILFPFWHDKYDPPSWVWGTQSTLMFRRALLAMILPATPSEAQGFRTCSDFYIVRIGQLIGGSFVFREALGCHRRHGGNNFCRNGLIAARMQTGDMRLHPSLAAFRTLVLQLMTARREEWLSVLGQARYDELRTHVGSLPDDVLAPQPPGYRRMLRSVLVGLLGQPTYVRLRLSLGRLVG